MTSHNSMDTINTDHPDFSAVSLQHPMHEQRLKLSTWMMNEKRDFPKFLVNNFSQGLRQHNRPNMTVFSSNSSSSETIVPMEHQIFVSEYMSRDTPYRGLLLYHGLGSGKTGSSIMIAEGYLGKQVVVLLPKSLRSNYEQEVKKKFGNAAFRQQHHWSFVPLEYTLDDSALVEEQLQVKGMDPSVLRQLYQNFQNNVGILHTKSVGTIVKINTEGHVQDDDSASTPSQFGIIQKVVQRESFTEYVVQPLDQPSSVTETYIDNTIEVAFGVMMMNVEKPPNYNTLLKKYQELLKTQIELMYNHKYQFLHYNAGATFWGSVFRNLIPPQVLQQMCLKLFGKPDVFASSARVSREARIQRDLAILNHIFDKSNSVANPFDNKVVIVDEIHNCASAMSGGGIGLPLLYETLMKANCKLVFLSGTPSINNPFELALMFNMLRGYIYSITLTIAKTSGKWNTATVKKILNRMAFIRRYDLNSRKKTVEIVQHTNDFVNKYDAQSQLIGVEKVYDSGATERVPRSDEELALLVHTELSKHGYEVVADVEHVKKSYTMFPDNLVKPTAKSKYKHIYTANISTRRDAQSLLKLGEQKFNEKYIDNHSFQVKADMIEEFQRKIIGLVSHYNEVSGIDDATQSPLFPSVTYAGAADTNVPMSEYQFQVYNALREKENEMDLAQRKRRQAASNADGALQLYQNKGHFRIYSRLAGLFVFPPKLQEVRESMRGPQDHPTRQLDFAAEAAKLSSHLCTLCNLDATNPAHTELIQAAHTFATQVSKTKVRSMVQKLEEVLELEQTAPQDLENQIRRLCNLTNVEELLNEILPEPVSESEAAITDFVAQLTPENLKEDGNTFYNLSLLSPKYCRVLKNCAESGGPVLVHSQFLRVEGLHLFARVLECNGYQPLNVERDTSSQKFHVSPPKHSDFSPGQKVRLCVSQSQQSWKTATVVRRLENSDTGQVRYKLQFGNGEFHSGFVSEDELSPACFALWTGETPDEVRSAILEYFNRAENKFGNLCAAILLTKAGAEGISLFYVRQVHLLEPYWNEVRKEQVIGRARRIKSHVLLPHDQQNVEVFTYCSVLPSALRDGRWGGHMIIRSLLDRKKYAPLFRRIKAPFDKDKFIQVEILQRLWPEDPNKNFQSVSRTLVNTTTHTTMADLDYIATVIEEAVQKLHQQHHQVSWKGGLARKTIVRHLRSGIESCSQTSKRIESRDNNETSDQVLQDIAAKKDSILKSFYRAMKGVAIDCEFNKESNLNSDHEQYTKIRCMNTIVDHDNNSYAFQLKDPEFIPIVAPDSQSGIETIQYTLSFLYYNAQNYSLLVKLPSSFTSVKDYCVQKEGGAEPLQLLDFYVYYGLSILEPKQLFLKQEKVVGKLLCGRDGRSFEIQLQPDFRQHLEYYKSIQARINRLGSKTPIDSNQVEQWRQGILQLENATPSGDEADSSDDSEDWDTI